MELSSKFIEIAADLSKLGDERDLFIAEIGLVEKRESKVSARLIYWAYLKWKHKRGESDSIITNKRFFFDFKRRFLHCRDGKKRYYCVDPTPFLIDKNETEIMNEYYKQQHLEDKKKTTCRKKSKALKRRHRELKKANQPERTKELRSLFYRKRKTQNSINTQKRKLLEKLMVVQVKLEKTEKEILKKSRALKKDSTPK